MLNRKSSEGQGDRSEARKQTKIRLGILTPNKVKDSSSGQFTPGDTITSKESMLFKTSSVKGSHRLIFADKPPNLITEQRAERRNKVYFETMGNRMPSNAIVSASGERSWLPKVYELGQN